MDYDADDDGLIEVTTEDQLSAIRWDLDGSGAVEDSANATTYAAAFPTPATNMGCPGTACTGYELAADISLTSSTGMGWEPIGDGSTGTPPSFTATFEGNGRTISNLVINRTTNNIGLFGATGSASAIRNVKLTSVNVTTTGSNVGALVGLNGDATNGGGRIDNCEATGTVTGRSLVGGLVGKNYGPISGSSASVAVTSTRIDGSALAGGLVGQNLQTTITNSHATGDVTASHDTVGGLVGSNYDDMASTTTALPRNAISGSTASGTVTTTGSEVGGLVGWNNGPISDSDALNPSVTGVSYVGGLVGQNDGADGAAGSNAISGSTASGTVTATGSFAGGLVGSNEGPISDSDALNPSVTGLSWVGGLVGFNANVWSISGSTARGPVTASGSFAGGLVGQNTGPISGSSATGTVTGRTWVGGLVGLNNGPISGSSASGEVTATRTDGASRAGGLVGENSGTPISNSHASGAVQGSSLYVGGLVGSNGTGGQVIDSRADGAVSGPDGAGYMGGLVGHNLGSVTGSVATGAVTGTAPGTAIGGLVGHNRGPISGSAATGAVSGGQQVGGLVGYGANVASITESWASGAVTAIADASVGGSGSDVGGLVGWNDGPLGASFASGNVTGVGSAGGLLGRNTGAVVAAYATGHVTVSAHVSCPSNSCASVAGGLIGIAVKNLGFSDSTASNVQASYSTGSVSGPSTHVVGGLAGTAQREVPASDSAVFTNSYWDNETSGQTLGVASDDEDANGMIDGMETATPGVTGQTTTALKAPTDYTGIFAAWNVTVPMATARTGGPWVFGAATDYPLLRGLGAPPSVPAGTATLSVAEERSAGTPIGSPLTATDADSNTLSYKLVGADGSYFGINGMTGQLSTKTLLDYENPVDGDRDNTYELMVQASDGMTVAFWTVTVTITNVNEAPTISGPATINVDEGHTGTLGMYGTDDPELSLTNWGFIGDNSALSGPDADRFRFDKETGRLTFAAPPDFEGVAAQGGGGQYEVTVDANDGELHGMLEVTVNVADVEEPGTLTFEQRQPVVGQPTTATLTEPDGVVGAVTWTWQRSTSASGGGTEIATATSRSYTPVTDDVNNYLTATATYEDGYGLDEMPQAVTEFTTAAANSMNAAPMLLDSVDAIELPENARPGMDAGSPVQATDTDGDPISYSLTGDSEFVIDQGTGQIKVAPDAVFDFDAGRRNYSVTVTAADSFGASDTVGVTIKITNVAEPPVAADDAPLGFDEDTAATIDVLANDSDPEDAKSALTVSVVRGPARGMVVVNDAVDPDEPTITYTPQANYNGADSFSYRVSDPGGLTSNVATVALTIYALNDAPEFPATTTTARSVSERAQHGDPVEAPVTAIDVDGDDLTYSLTGSTSFEMLDGTAQITVREGAALDATNEPTHMVTVTAADGQGSTASIAVTITVTTGPVIPPNNAPTFASPTAARSVPEDATGSARVGARVTATDIDAGDILTYRLSGADASSFVIDSNGQITVAAGVTFNMAMKPTYTVTVTAADEAGATASIDVTITVTTGPVIPPNNAPVAADDAPLGFNEDTAATIDVLANDSDPEDAKSALTVSVVRGPARGMVVVNDAVDPGGPTITYTPQANYNGADSFSYRVTDSGGLTSNVATVVLTIYALNDAPEFPATTTAARSVPEDATGGALVGERVTATDIDAGDILTYRLSGADASSFVIDSNGQITVAAGVTFNMAMKPTYTVTVTAADEAGATASIDVTITVTTGPVIPPNNAPVAVDDAPLGFDEDTAATIDVLANDSDPEDAKSALTVSVVRGPARGMVVVNDAVDPDGPTITYTPQANYNGSDSFSYRVTDSGGLTSNVATVVLTIYALNDAPEFPATTTTARSVSERAQYRDPVGAPVTAVDVDGDGDVLYYTLTDSSNNFEIDSGTAQITVSETAALDATNAPTHMVTVTVADGQGSTASIVVIITVTTGPVVIPPVVIPPTGGGGGGGSFAGGGGGPSGPTPSEVDFEWNVTRDIEELDGGHDKPSGTWSDGATLWVLENGDGADDAIYAYDLASGERVEGREFKLDETNRAPRGVWSDRTVIWVSDSGRNRLFAHNLASGERLPERDIALAERNRAARGIWSDEETMWVLDGGKDSLFAYDLASGELLAEYALDSTNDDPHGIWSDRVTVWVSNHDPKRLFAYRLPAPEGPAAEDAERQALERVSDEEFDKLSRASNNSPRGIWSDGEVMYVADESDGKVYSYNMPDAIDARLASLTLSGVEIGEFDPVTVDYEGTPGEGVTETTVEAVPAQSGASVAIDPPDADAGTDGHQVSLDGADITVTVMSPDGSRTRVYRVALEAPPVELALTPAWTAIDWPGADGVAIAEALREGGISDNVLVIYEWDEAAQTWKGFFPGLEDVPGLNTLTNLSTGATYWVAVSEPVTWTVPR